MVSGDFETDGFAIVAGVLTADEVDALAAEFAVAEGVSSAGALQRGGQVYARRNVLTDVRLVRGLARSEAVRSLVEPVLGSGAFASRGLLFDKTSEANWMVPWHQDLTVAVKARIDAPGFGPWTVKAGVAHVRPPVSVLERMLTVRVHLDDCGPGLGPLRVLPGSHRDGRIGAEGCRAWLERVEAVPCLVTRGAVVLMRPLLLHASSAADVPGHRRVVHLEFAAEPLPHGVEWYERV